MSKKPSGDIAPPDQSMRLPATFINDFRIMMNTDFTRVTTIESAGDAGHLRMAFVSPTPVLIELAELILKTAQSQEARAKIIMPGPGANTA